MNKRLFVTLSMAGLAMVAFGARKPKAAIKSSVKTVAIQQPTFTEWHDLQVNEINRLPLHTLHFAYDPNDFPGTGAEYLDKKKSMNYLSLEGTWKFNWVANADERPTDFYKTDLDDSKWNNIQMPGNWEMLGYGQPEYVNVGFAWRGHFDQQPVADPMPEAVVHELEIVEIDKGQRPPVAAPLRLAQHLLQPVLQQVAVGQAGQRVMRCLIFQLLAIVVLSGDVFNRSLIVQRLTILPQYGMGVLGDPDTAAVTAIVPSRLILTAVSSTGNGSASVSTDAISSSVM